MASVFRMFRIAAAGLALGALAVGSRPKVPLRPFPEYERQSQQILLTYYNSLEIYGSLFEDLPPYTTVDILVHPIKKRQLEEELTHIPAGRRVRLLVTEDPLPFDLGGWTQKFVEVVQGPSGTELILPRSAGTLQDTLQRGGYHVRIAADDFDGADIIMDYWDQQAVLLISPDAHVQPQQFADFVGADRTILLGGLPPESLYDLDMLMTIVRPKEAVLLSLDHITETDARLAEISFRRSRDALERMPADNLTYDAQALRAIFTRYGELEGKIGEELRACQRHTADIRGQLQRLGYTVHNFLGNVTQLLLFQSYLNGTPFTHPQKGPMYVLPIFPDEQGSYDTPENSAAMVFFRGIGIEPLPIKNTSWPMNGNFECLAVTLR